MTQFNYYEAPPAEVFEDIKERAMALWGTYNDEYGYATEKIDRIRNLLNIKDNAWYIVGMFDQENQAILFSRLKPESQVAFMRMKAWEASQI